jgi:transposase
MSKPLSLDLRERVVASVSDGMSRRQAAERFGVSAASAIRWCALDRDTGSPQAKPQGGDRHSHRIEAQADLIMALVDGTSDITLMELQARLAEQGHRFGIGTLWRFFDRRGITWKKRLRTPASRIARTS